MPRRAKPVTLQGPKAKVPPPGASRRAEPDKAAAKPAAEAPGPPAAPPLDPPDAPPVDPQETRPVDPPDGPPVELPDAASGRRNAD